MPTVANILCGIVISTTEKRVSLRLRDGRQKTERSPEGVHHQAAATALDAACALCLSDVSKQIAAARKALSADL